MTQALYLYVPILLLAAFVLAWWAQQYTRNASWVDVLWAFGVGGTGAFYTLVGEGDSLVRLIVGAAYVLWFGRLGCHLLLRVLKESEDGRYAYLRGWAGSKAGGVFLLFYLMQASWVWIFTLPAWWLSQAVEPSSWAMFVGVMIILISWFGEALADHQLSSFKSVPENKGKTCRQGLWRYTRHPNYFFEWCHWFAYPVMAIGVPGAMWLWGAPIVMFIFLYFITGIPFTEKQALRSRGNDYRQYQQTTSMFIPWKPKPLNLDRACESG